MKKYLPKNKSDITAIKYLKSLPFETIQHEIPELLTWLQDLNWEVAVGVSEFLTPYVNKIKYDLIPILNDNDEQWKWGILIGLVDRSPDKIDLELLTIIKRFADNPTEKEIDNDVDIVAKRIIEKHICG